MNVWDGGQSLQDCAYGASYKRHIYGLGIIAFVFSPEGESWRLLMEAGTILLLFTPIVKVTVAGYMFKNRGEKANAATALLVLIFMLLSLVLGIFLRIK